ncbi:MAG: phosphonopyruvate decarboxylase [Clostridium sp.]|nr:phosphonopyruvate decarboxylase [Clostridium sp.]
MTVENLLNIIDSDFYVGVPDSQLKALCDYLMDRYGIDARHHVITANEGNAVALATGYHFATGKTPVVYMQNSGEGNIVNPVASLMNDKVYGVPCIFIIGWRGEPGVHDEPQHIFQGEITLKLLEAMDIAAYVIDDITTEDDISGAMAEFRKLLSNGKQAAFVVKKNAISYESTVKYENHNALVRETVIEHIVDACGEDIVVSTTGKASRELFEIREAKKQGHQYDFLTVGSMGHASTIALGVAVSKPNTKVWCIDGDGAALMHMGAMAVIGSSKPNNLIHVIINNAAHETVGGMPTVAGTVDITGIAKACGYVYVCSVDTYEALDKELEAAKAANVLTLIEVKCNIGSRKDLGRPTTTAVENKRSFMEYLKTVE